MPERTPGHLKTFGYIGLYRYALTFCCHDKQRRFERADAVDLVLSQIRRAANDEHFVVSAYCFMPNHLHLLVKALVEASDALKFIKRAKQFSGFYYKQKYHVPLWQRYSYEHVLRDDDDLRRAAKYIFENPVRASLVSSPQNYPFLGSDTHSVNDILALVAISSRPQTSG
jgi:putative transposase